MAGSNRWVCLIKLIVLEIRVIIKIFVCIKDGSGEPICIEFAIYNVQFIHKDCSKGGIIVAAYNIPCFQFLDKMSAMVSRCLQNDGWTYVHVNGWNVVVICEDVSYQVNHISCKYYSQ